jgi:hypothetical protein
MFVPGKLVNTGQTNTSLVEKLLNYGRKTFYNIGPIGRIFSRVRPYYERALLGRSQLVHRRIARAYC